MTENRRQRETGRFLSAGEDGSAIVVVLMVMMALTVFGVLSINLSSIEMQIVQNGKEGRENFYLSESAALEGIQRIADMDAADMEDKIAFWHHSRKEEREKEMDFRSPGTWVVDGLDQSNAHKCLMGESLYFAAVESRLATGGSFIVTDSRLYLNRVYGLCNRNNQPCIVEIGYYKRY